MPYSYKKEYTTAVIEDLTIIGGVKIVAGDEINIPTWQIEPGAKKLEDIASGNAELMLWKHTKQNLCHNL